MKNKSLKASGFTLVELLTVVAIVAVISVSSVVGFGYLGDTLKAREVTNFMADVVKQEELKVLRGDFEKVTIRFEEDYLIITEELEDGLTLSVKAGGDLQHSGSGNLIKKDELKKILEVISVSGSPTNVSGFESAEEIEWNFQLNDNGELSDIVRFVHFNLQREDLSNPISIIYGQGSKVEISAPYAKKQLYSGGPVDSFLIRVEDKSGNATNEITIN